jgi:glucosamine-6-phosphate deaminase
MSETGTDAAGSLAIHRYLTRSALGAAAAAHAAAAIRRLATEHSVVPVIFATGASQLATLRALTALAGIPWDRVIGFHMDEYVGISGEHPASFRRYLRDELVSKVPLREFHNVDGDAADPERESERYAALLRSYSPRLCLAGIGENGHLAFNDPPVADFNDPRDAKTVTLDRECREQQVAEGWFPNFEAVPSRAITLTIPALFRVPEIILSVPGERKTAIVARTLRDEISTKCPATILRTHTNAHLYLDDESAKLL